MAPEMGLNLKNDVVGNCALWHRWDVSGGCMDRMDIPSPVALPQDMAQMMRLPEEVGSRRRSVLPPHPSCLLETGGNADLHLLLRGRHCRCPLRP